MEQCTTTTTTTTTIALDPYEQQLLKVFDSHDNDNKGSLDKNGLIKLCETLHLEEKCDGLLKSLLDERKTTRATFTEFRDALLRLLGHMQQTKTNEIDASPEREVLPKFVYGSKKYGRRSRPRCEEFQTNKNDENQLNNNKTVGSNNNNALVQRSNSQCEVSNNKKRKTAMGRLKRCTSFPTVSDYQKSDECLTDSCTEDMLREVWKKLGVGEDGTLNQHELLMVCDAIGLNKLADSVIRHLSKTAVLEYSKKITFQELLDVLQQDDVWNDVLQPQTTTVEIADVEDDFSLMMNFHNNKVLQHIKMGPDGVGFISSDLIIDLWETAGIVAPKSLLSDLGFNHASINIQELYLVLDKEIKSLNEFRIDYTNNPHLALLQAFLTLYQIEIKSLKGILEQITEEKEKLKCDISVANNRASLLAQEVDDNVAKMEINTQKHVKLLEQRHTELLKDMQDQFQTDKEQMALLNQNLEMKIQNLEGEALKLHDDLLNAQKYSKIIENENRELNQKIIDLQHTKAVLEQHIQSLEMDKFKLGDMEKDKRDELVARLSEIQKENTNLRDKHDEMICTIETLTNENHLLKNNRTSLVLIDGGDVDDEIEDANELENFACIYEGVGLVGNKRRNGDSPSNELVVLGNTDAESPRLGKIRKFQSSTMSFNERSLLDDDLESSIDQQNQNDTNAMLELRIKYLEELLAKHSIDIHTGANSDISKYMNSKDLIYKYNNLLEHLLIALYNKRTNKDDNSKCVDLDEKEMNYLLNNSESESGSDDDLCDIKSKLSELELTNKELITKCEDYENALVQLRNEYEMCEDYWQNKLEEERNLFEQEQNHSSDKLNELIKKLAEFEDQYSNDNRLPTIDETSNLEKQFTDLEQEFDEYKKLTEMTLSEKDMEINSLKLELDKLSLNQIKNDVGVQVQQSGEMVEQHKTLMNLSNHVIEATNLYSTDMLPFNWQTQNTMVGGGGNDADNVPENKTFLYELPSTSNSPSEMSMPVRQKRIRQHNKSITTQRRPPNNNNLIKKNNSADVVDYKSTASPLNGTSNNKCEDLNDTTAINQKCWVPVTILQGLQAKRHHLEQRCKRLQFIMKQQHLYDEQLLHYAWQQYTTDKAELQNYIKYYQEKLDQQIRLTKEYQERLAKNDLLVKDFFIDNAYLMAENQRLEQKFHMLTHSMNISSI